MIKVIARDSKLSQIQVKEVMDALEGVDYQTKYIQTRGDKDKTTSLMALGRCDFFTREIDEAIIRGDADVAIHSAKDLPDPLPSSLELIALTRGVDASDCLVLRDGYCLGTLPEGAGIGTSSKRRIEMVHALREDLSPIDVRGTIEERLRLIETEKNMYGIVVAKAALIRLGLTHLNMIQLSGPTAENQGKLAIVALRGRVDLQRLFEPVDARALSRA